MKNNSDMSFGALAVWHSSTHKAGKKETNYSTDKTTMEKLDAIASDWAFLAK